MGHRLAGICAPVVGLGMLSLYELASGAHADSWPTPVLLWVDESLAWAPKAGHDRVLTALRGRTLDREEARAFLRRAVRMAETDPLRRAVARLRVATTAYPHDNRSARFYQPPPGPSASSIASMPMQDAEFAPRLEFMKEVFGSPRDLENLAGVISSANRWIAGEGQFVLYRLINLSWPELDRAILDALLRSPGVPEFTRRGIAQYRPSVVELALISAHPDEQAAAVDLVASFAPHDAWMDRIMDLYSSLPRHRERIDAAPIEQWHKYSTYWSAMLAHHDPSVPFPGAIDVDRMEANIEPLALAIRLLRHLDEPKYERWLRALEAEIEPAAWRQLEEYVEKGLPQYR